MKKENDPGYARRNIPVEFEDYIAQTFGYDNLMRVPKNQFKKIKAVIKERFSQTGTTIRKPYSKKTQIVLRGDDETELDFAKRVDYFLHENDVTITQEYEVKINFGAQPQKSMLSVEDNKVLTGCPFDEPLPPIPGDAETLVLSNLSPELIKKVAAELLELEKTAKYRVHDEYIYEVDDANRRRIEKLINLSLNYSTPIFDLKTLNRSVADANIAMKKWREALDALFNDPTTTARRYGQKILNAIPKKHAFAKGGSINETGPEQIIDHAGKTRTAPCDLKIETNQQWSPEELKEWLAKPEQQNRKTYVFREDRAQPGNTAQQRKPYREPIMAAASNDGVNWEAIAQQMNRGIGNYGFDPGRNGSDKSVYAVVSKDEVRIRNYTPDSWPPNAPPYHTPEGWEFEKAMKRRQLKSMLTIEWLEKQQTEKHALVAQRLREILAA